MIAASQESSDSDNENSESNHVDVISQVESWEENWLFQKKKMQTRSEPVVMLVPNPSAEFRALIGDKDAEDTSDLSECFAQSDEEIEQELQAVIENVIPKHEHEIDNEMNGFNGHEEEVPTNLEAKLNGDVKIEQKNKMKQNGVGALTNPFADCKTEVECGKRNPFRNANLRIELDDSEVQLFQDIISPKTPMPTPVNDSVQQFVGCDANVLCEKLDNVKNPFRLHLNDQEEFKSGKANSLC